MSLCVQVVRAGERLEMELGTDVIPDPVPAEDGANSQEAGGDPTKPS